MDQLRRRRKKENSQLGFLIQPAVSTPKKEAKSRRGTNPQMSIIFNNKFNKVGFWNVAGLWKKDMDFWRYIESFDYIGLTETWVEEKGWENLKARLPKTFNWIYLSAIRENKKGRAKGGILTGVRKGVEELGNRCTHLGNKPGAGGLIERKIRINDEIWKIKTVYCGGKTKETLDALNEELEEDREENMLLGGDFNARIGIKGEIYAGYDLGYDEKSIRKSKDKIRNAEGDLLLQIAEDRGWHFLNGNIPGDEEGEYTYVGSNGVSVIDYVLINSICLDKIKKFTVDERTESDHQPLKVELNSDLEQAEEPGDEMQEEDAEEYNDWTEKSIDKYGEKTKVMEYQETTVEESWKELRDKISSCIVKKKAHKKNRKIGYKKWWDKECKCKKRKMKNLYISWKKGEGNKFDYTESRKSFRKMCKEKEAKLKEDEVKEIRKIKTESDVWKYLNKGRKKRIPPEEEITMQTWKKHFMDILNGSNECKKGEQRTQVDPESDETNLEDEEIIKQLRKLKKKKATGTDGLQNETWIHSQGNTSRKLMEIIKRVWTGEGFPDDWRESVISPLHKKGEMTDVRNYRGISLLNTSYKVYAAVLNERLKSDIEGKGILPDVQAGFRKGRSTIDCIYTLHHAADKELERKRGKLFTCFVDLKAAFDKVERGLLWKVMEKRGVRNGLIERIKEIYETTKNIVKVGKNRSEDFWTESGVRQGCPLSPTLFTIFISDLEETFQKGQAGGVVVGKTKFWSLSYADDLVLVARTELDLKSMLITLERYLDRRKLTLSVEKSKIMVFRKGGGKTRQRIWKWKEENLEEVNEFKYLGYLIQRNGEPTAHINELAKKASIVMKSVWGLGERKFKEDSWRRLWMFEHLVLSVMTYGAELWGWKERAKLEQIQNKYIKWTLGLDRCTPEYICLEETNRDKIKIKTGRRAIKFELRARRNENKTLLQECIKERVNGKVKSKNIQDRDEYLKGKGFSQAALELEMQEGKDVIEELVKRDKEIQGQTQYNRIQNSNYNRRYKHCKTFGLPAYLKKSGTKGSQKLIARARCGSIEERNKHWLKEVDRLCELCGEDQGTLEHLLDKCTGLEGEGPRIEEIINEKENNRALNWLRNLEKKKADLRRKLEKIREITTAV